VKHFCVGGVDRVGEGAAGARRSATAPGICCWGALGRRGRPGSTRAGRGLVDGGARPSGLAAGSSRVRSAGGIGAPPSRVGLAGEPGAPGSSDPGSRSPPSSVPRLRLVPGLNWEQAKHETVVGSLASLGALAAATRDPGRCRLPEAAGGAPRVASATAPRAATLVRLQRRPNRFRALAGRAVVFPSSRKPPRLRNGRPVRCPRTTDRAAARASRLSRPRKPETS
jgi:hypothetical protein